MTTKAKLLIKSLKFIQMQNSITNDGTAAESSTNAELNSSAPIMPNLMLCDVYESILKIFTSKDDFRNWMQTSFLVGKKVVATNGWSLVAVPKFNNSYEDNSEKTKTVYPIEYNCDKDILITEIKKAIAKAPLIDCFDEQKEKYDACYGDGEVEYEFSHRMKDYTIEHECPICDGQGITYKTSAIPNGKKEIDYFKHIRIGNSIFNIKRLEDLIKTAELLESDKVKLVKQTGSQQTNLFAIKDVEVLLMPVMVSSEEAVCANIA
jgi:hypothetical protein